MEHHFVLPATRPRLHLGSKAKLGENWARGNLGIPQGQVPTGEKRRISKSRESSPIGQEGTPGGADRDSPRYNDDDDAVAEPYRLGRTTINSESLVN